MYQFDIVGESWFCHPSPPYEIGLFLKVATFYRLCQLCFMHNPQLFNDDYVFASDEIFVGIKFFIDPLYSFL